jgi:hypothetical protein
LHKKKLQFRKKQFLKYLVSKPNKELFFKRLSNFLKYRNRKSNSYMITYNNKKKKTFKKRKKIENKIFNFLGSVFKKIIYKKTIKIKSKYFKRFKYNIRNRRKFFKEHIIKKNFFFKSVNRFCFNINKKNLKTNKFNYFLKSQGQSNFAIKKEYAFYNSSKILKKNKNYFLGL